MTTEHTSAEPSVGAERFYEGVYRRVGWWMVGSFVVLTPALGYWGGWPSVLGFLAGALISAGNFYLLQRSVFKLADRISGGEKSDGGGVVAGSVFRYLLLGLVVYAILTSSAVSLKALCAGLFLPILALSIEAAYELYAALRFHY
jgi:hypothetical protein